MAKPNDFKVPHQSKSILKNMSGFFLDLYPTLKNYRLFLLFSLLTTISASVLSLTYPKLAGIIIDDALVANELEQLLPGIYVLIFLAVGGNLLGYVGDRLKAQTKEKITIEIRFKLHAFLLKKLPTSFFDKRDSGDLISRVVADLTILEDGIEFILSQGIWGVIRIIGVIVLTLSISWKLLLVFVGIIPFLGVTMWLNGKYIPSLAAKLQKSKAKSTSVLQESIVGMSTVKMFSREDHEINRFQSSVYENYEASQNLARTTAKLKNTERLVMDLGLVTVLTSGAYLLMKHELSPGDLASFFLYLFTGISGIQIILHLWNTWHLMIGATEEVFSILKHSAESPVSVEQVAPRPPAQGSIHLENVSFHYPSTDEKVVLNNINLKINKGEKIAFVGPSGSGKTTAIKLLTRFYEPTAGRVLLNGEDIHYYDLEQYRSLISYVGLDEIVFSRSIKENILYGNLESRDDEIAQAAQWAEIHDFIKDHPEQYERLLGERGMSLSNGQRQRISLARAYLKKPKIWILDEATNALDLQTEKSILQFFSDSPEEQTVIITAHRLNSLKFVDRIIVFNEGEIKEEGNHEELLLSGGLYAQLYETQMA